MDLRIRGLLHLTVKKVDEIDEPCQEIKDILKLMSFPLTSPLELFIISQDPYEKNNVISQHEDIAISLLRKIFDYFVEMFPA